MIGISLVLTLFIYLFPFFFFSLVGTMDLYFSLISEFRCVIFLLLLNIKVSLSESVFGGGGGGGGNHLDTHDKILYLLQIIFGYCEGFCWDY